MRRDTDKVEWHHEPVPITHNLYRSPLKPVLSPSLSWVQNTPVRTTTPLALPLLPGEEHFLWTPLLPYLWDTTACR